MVIFAKDPHEAVIARWWLIPSWHKGELKDWEAATFNARIEDAQHKPAFRAVWRRGHCIIPAAGYYQWTGEKGSKHPHFIRSAGNTETIWFASLASRWQDLLTCTILTRAANPTVEQIHDRMPVILDPEERDGWLAGSDDLSIGKDTALKHYLVQPFGVRDDGPELIEPLS